MVALISFIAAAIFLEIARPKVIGGEITGCFYNKDLEVKTPWRKVPLAVAIFFVIFAVLQYF